MKEQTSSHDFQLLTVREAAERLSCSINNLYNLINSGQLPVVCVGRAKGYRVDSRDLESFIDANKQRLANAEVIVRRSASRSGDIQLRNLKLK